MKEEGLRGGMSEAAKGEIREYPQCEHFHCAHQYGERILEINHCDGFEPWSCRRTQKEGKCRNEELTAKDKVPLPKPEGEL